MNNIKYQYVQSYFVHKFNSNQLLIMRRTDIRFTISAYLDQARTDKFYNEQNV